MCGLNQRARHDNVRKVVEVSRPVVVCLWETKLSHIIIWDIMSIPDQDFQHFTFLLAQGTRGVVLVA
jgi:hypothetical protein